MTIVIIGGGIIGVMTAYYVLADSPASSVILIESNDVASAASGNAGGFMARDWHSEESSSLAELSFNLHAKLAEEYGGLQIWGYRKLDTLQLQCNQSPRAKSRNKHENAIKDWIDMSIVESADSIGDTTSTAQVTPAKFTRFFYKKAVEMGLKYIKGHVVSIDRIKNTVTLQDSKDKIAFDKLVIAAGPWTPHLLPELGKKFKMHSSRAHSITLDATVPAVALFTDIMRKDGSRADPEIYPRPHNEVYVCAGGVGFQSTLVALPMNPADVEVDESVCEKLYEVVSEISPILSNGNISKRSACYLPFATRPVIGRVHGDVWVASGHGVWGITLGPGTGKILSELILTGSAVSANIQKLKP